MAGQLCLFLCVVVTIQWCSAQAPWGQFSGLRGFSPLPFGGGMNQFGGQQQNTNLYQYVNCGAADNSQNELKVTFSRPVSAQNNMLQQQFPWLRQQQTSTENEPVRMEFSIKSAGQQLSGNMQLVMTEYGPASPGMCNPALLGSIKQGFRRNQMTPFSNPWNPAQSFSPNNNLPAGQLGSGFFLQPGQSFQISRNVEINFDEMAGSGIALCRGINGNQCTFMLSLCCTLSKGTSSLVAAQFNQAQNQFGQNGFGQMSNTGFGQTGFNQATNVNTNPNPATNTNTNTGFF